MLYRIIAFVIEVAVRQFFQRISVSGAPPVATGPVIVAANHPNQAVDSFLIGATFHRPMSFLAKSTLFSNHFLAVFFREMRMVPVYRARDNSDTASNQEMFKDVVARLHADEAIVIFPEGTSSEERRILPLKTGVARIAFQAEVSKDWNANVVIQPVGITYLSPRLFQSSVAIAIGEAIAVNSFRTQHDEDAQAAVKALTAEVEERLRALTVSLPNIDLQQDIERITELFDNQQDMRERMQYIADQVTKISNVLPQETAALRTEMESVSKKGFELGFFGVGSQTMIDQPISTARLVVVLFGRLIHLVPYYATRIAVAIYVKDPHNLASTKIGFGIVFYAMWYAAILIVAVDFGIGGYAACALVILVMIVGDKTNRYTDGAVVYFKQLISRIVSGKNSPEAYHQQVNEFLEQRAALRERLIEITEKYRAEHP